MNKYFHDTRYHLKRASTTAKSGLEETFEPVRARVDARLDRTDDADPSRLERMQFELRDFADRAKRSVNDSVEWARRKLGREAPEDSSA